MEAKATTTKKFFSRETVIELNINAKFDKIWSILTNLNDWKWNSTIVSINGKIAIGEAINLVSTLDPKRTFKLKVKEVVANKRFVWGDAMGNRVYELSENPDGSTKFSMREKIGGPLFPLFAKMIPPFDESFEQFAKDLKTKSENQ